MVGGKDMVLAQRPDGSRGVVDRVEFTRLEALRASTPGYDAEVRASIHWKNRAGCLWSVLIYMKILPLKMKILPFQDDFGATSYVCLLEGDDSSGVSLRILYVM